MNRLKKTTFAVLGIVVAVGLVGFVRVYHVRPYFDQTEGKWHVFYGCYRYYGDVNKATFFEEGKLLRIVHLGCG